MNLVIDIGNTNTKVSLFKDGNSVYETTEISLSLDLIDTLLGKYTTINKCILSATGHIPEGIKEKLERSIEYFVLFKQNTSLPFVSKYRSPSTIGLDRLAAVAGANKLYNKKNILIIDAGTAITYDFINDQQQYLGGNIAPGMMIRFKSLHDYTAKLPYLQASESFQLIGETTDEAINNGVVNGIIFEMNGMIDAMDKIYNNLTIILTGGDAGFFDNKLKKTIFVLQNLVSIGLNTILNYNVANR